MIAAFALAGIWLFWQVSLASNDVPSDQTFPGWLAVLQPADASFGDQLKVVVGLTASVGRGHEPELEYTVVACGAHPFEGVLVAGGAARLSEPQSVDAESVKEIPQLRLYDEGRGVVVPLGPAQIVRMALPAQRCIAPFSTKSPEPQFGGVAMTVAGRASALVEQRRHPVFGWEAPRWTEAWPLVGDFPGVLPGEIGDWQFVGLPGTWVRPIAEYLEVDGGGLPLGSAVEAASPPVTTGSGLEWTSTSPFQASARVVDGDDQTVWQDRVVAATIWLTLGGGLLCTVLYEFVPKVRRETDSVARPDARPDHPTGETASERTDTPADGTAEQDAIRETQQVSSGPRAAWMAAVLLVTLVNQWLRRRRPSR
ncbi:MAG: hypothetical protein ABSG43_20755 [Solirubrobacteraceae bacterium]